MKYEAINGLSDVNFRRLTGVKRTTFTLMMSVLKLAEEKRRRGGGRASGLSLEDQLLMTLEYLREYRTYFHISQSYGLSESRCFRVICWVENTLIKHPEFALPGRKALTQSDMQYEVVVIDATECPIERPKKSRGNTTQARENATHRRFR